MRVGLHDAERDYLKHKRFPNYALMKISAYHKARGDSVEWWDPITSHTFDVIYSSKVFDFTPENPYLPPSAIRGGTGYADIPINQTYVAVHAAKLDAWKSGILEAGKMPEIEKILSEHQGTGNRPARLAYGAVVGAVEIVDCVPVEEIMHTLTERERLLGDYSPGRFAWVLRNPIMFEKPIPARGKQGWWDWPFVLIETGNKMGSGKSDGSDTRIIWGAGCGPK